MDHAEEVERLRELKAQWLQTPQREELDGFSPAQVIERERSRLPLAVSGEHAMADDDCPLCQMMADQSAPVILHLDGCNRDDDFAFSFHSTRAEWEEEQRYWHERVTRAGLHVSPFIDRFYFQSIYFRVSNGILFEIATDGPGFAVDEDMDTLGEQLALPPFLEPRRAQIEAGLKPIVVAE